MSAPGDPPRQQARKPLTPLRLLGGVLLALLPVALIVGWTATRGEGRSTLAQLGADADVLGVVVAILVVSAANWCVGLRWQTMLRVASRPSTTMLTAFSVLGSLFNFVLPGPVGELVAAGLVQHRYGIPTPVALLASVQARLLGPLSAGVIALGAWLLFEIQIDPERAYLPTVAVGAVLGMTVLLGMSTAAPATGLRVGTACLELVARLPRLSGPSLRLSRVLEEQVGRMIEHRPTRGQFVRAFFVSVLGQLIAAFGIWLAAVALGLDASLPAIVFVANACTILGVVIYLMPGALVAWDLMFVGMLIGSAGLDMPQAAGLLAAVRLQFVFMLVIGGLLIPWVGRDLLTGLLAGTDAKAEPADQG